MQQPMDWRMLLVGFFVGLGVFFLISGRWLEGAWGAVIGIGTLGIVYFRDRPERNLGVLGWALVIGWTVLLGWLTLQLFLQ
jgi:hypothetical protein